MDTIVLYVILHVKEVYRYVSPSTMQTITRSTIRAKVFSGKKVTPDKIHFLRKVHYRSELWDHLFFDDCLNYLNFNSVSDKICTLKNVTAIKIIFKISLE